EDWSLARKYSKIEVLSLPGAPRANPWAPGAPIAAATLPVLFAAPCASPWAPRAPACMKMGF
ncbi:hypothetical protein A2U01_0114021, partial [Trifolium medium]|nr:hypothetical protein [Trifolium medium]